MAAKTVKLNDSGELNVRTEIALWDEPDMDSGYSSQVIPGVTNPVMFHHSTVPDPLLTVSEAGDHPQLHRQPEPDRDKPVGQGVKAEDQHDLRPDPTVVEMDAFWADLSMDAQATIKRVITRHVAARDGDVVAQWLTLPAMLAEMAHLGIQRVLRMASDVSDDEPVICSAFADSPEDIRARVRQMRAEQQAARALFDADQRESAAWVTGIDHAALASDPGAAALVDYQLPGGGSFVVSVTGDGFGWAVPLMASEVEALPWPSVEESESRPFAPVDDMVTSVMDDLAADGLGAVDADFELPIYHGPYKTAWANANPVAMAVDIDLHLITQPALLATVTDGNRTIAMSDSIPMVVPQRIQSVASSGRGPPNGWRGCIGVVMRSMNGILA